MEAWIKAVLVSIHNSKMCKKLCSIFFRYLSPNSEEFVSLVWFRWHAFAVAILFVRSKLKRAQQIGEKKLLRNDFFVWFRYICMLLLCAPVFFSLRRFFLWARNCLLDYICFSNWYIVTLCFYSGLLSLHCASFVLPLSLCCARVSNVVACKHDLPTWVNMEKVW